MFIVLLVALAASVALALWLTTRIGHARQAHAELAIAAAQLRERNEQLTLQLGQAHAQRAQEQHDVRSERERAQAERQQAVAERERLIAERGSFVARLEQQAQALSKLGQALELSRAEAKQDAERGRSANLEAYGAQMSKMQAQMHEVLRLTHEQMESGRKSTDQRLQHLTGSLGEQLQAHNSVLHAVQEQLGQLGEAAKGMQALGQDIASLQDILQAPKLRGNLGELLLAEILGQVLPKSAFELQYRFPADAQGSEVIVDAVIRLGERLVPIDSKFPLESFRRVLAGQSQEESQLKLRRQFLEVVRGHIDAVAAKYIRPDRETYEFALAYLPAENVYYEAIVRHSEGDEGQSIIAYAASKGVVPVSPSTLYAYLLTVAYGLRGLRIEQQAETIRSELAAFHNKFVTFYDTMKKTQKHLGQAARSHEDALRRADRLNDQVGKITGAALELELADPAELLERDVPAPRALPPS